VAQVGAMSTEHTEAACGLVLMLAVSALIAAVLIATNASDYFTQDIEDFIDYIKGEFYSYILQNTGIQTYWD
jgi:hypothetical protein